MGAGHFGQISLFLPLYGFASTRCPHGLLNRGNAGPSKKKCFSNALGYTLVVLEIL